MVKIIKYKSVFSYVEERDWYLGSLKLREVVIKEEEETHYDNGLILKETNTYYIRCDNNGKVCSGEVSYGGIIRRISCERGLEVINSVDWNTAV